jgi:hypothetical protein
LFLPQICPKSPNKNHQFIDAIVNIVCTRQRIKVILKIILRINALLLKGQVKKYKFLGKFKSKASNKLYNFEKIKIIGKIGNGGYGTVLCGQILNK